MSQIKKIKNIKCLIVNQNGEGQGLKTVSTSNVSYGRIRNIVGGLVEIYPFKMIYNKKKYWMVVNEEGRMQFDKPGQFMPFTCGMMNVEFEYTYGGKAHPEDLMFNGIQLVNMFGPNAIINHYGPLVFIEALEGETDTFSDYWQEHKAVC
jgi:hypothetical protein